MTVNSKNDNSETSISIRAMKVTYLYLVISLFLYGIIEVFTAPNQPNHALFLLVSQYLIFVLSKLYIKRRKCNKNEEI